MDKSIFNKKIVFMLGGAFLASNAIAQKPQDPIKTRLDALEKKIESLKDKTLTKENAVNDGNNLKLKIYGHLNRAMLYRHNGRNGHLDHVDNDALSSRFAFLATKEMGANQTIGGLLEFNMTQNPALNSDIKNTHNNPAAVTLRNAQVFIKNKTYGELYLGRGPMASDSSIEDPDLSGTSHVFLGANGLEMLASVSLINKATRQKQPLGGGVSTTLRVQDIVPSTDGLSRQDRIRYNTPTFYGFSIGASHAYNTPTTDKGNDLWDVALRWNAKVNDNQYSAVAAYAEDHTFPMKGNVINTNTTMKQFSGSAGILFKSGFNIFVAGAHRHYTFSHSRNGHMLFTKIGYQHKFTQAGMTSFAVDFGDFQNFLIDTTSADSIRFKYRGLVKGIALNQNLERVATDIYLAYRHINFKLKGHGSGNTKFKPVQAVMMGARIKF